MANEQEPLRPATEDEIKQALSFALCFDGKKRNPRADRLMAQITAEHLVRYLETAGFVVLKKPPRASHSTHSK